MQRTVKKTIRSNKDWEEALDLNHPSVDVTSPNASLNLVTNQNATVLEQQESIIVIRPRSSSLPPAFSEEEKQKVLKSKLTQSAPEPESLPETIESPSADTATEMPPAPVVEPLHEETSSATPTLVSREESITPEEEKIVEITEVLDEEPLRLTQREFNEDQKAWKKIIEYRWPKSSQNENVPLKSPPLEDSLQLTEKAQAHQAAMKELAEKIETSNKLFQENAARTDQILQECLAINDKHYRSLRELIEKSQSWSYYPGRHFFIWLSSLWNLPEGLFVGGTLLALVVGGLYLWRSWRGDPALGHMAEIAKKALDSPNRPALPPAPPSPPSTAPSPLTISQGLAQIFAAIAEWIRKHTNK